MNRLTDEEKLVSELQYASGDDLPSEYHEAVRIVWQNYEKLKQENEQLRAEVERLQQENEQLCKERDKLEGIVKKRIKDLESYKPKNLIDEVNTTGVLALLDGILSEWRGLKGAEHE